MTHKHGRRDEVINKSKLALPQQSDRVFLLDTAAFIRPFNTGMKSTLPMPRPWFQCAIPEVAVGLQVSMLLFRRALRPI